MTEYNTREDGKPYSSAVAAETTCGYCGASITQRSEGRTRKFCDATCRSNAHRAMPKPSRFAPRRRRTTKRV